MAQLYQLIQNVPGLSGNNSYEKQADLWRKLGGGGNYVGSYDQNMLLLSKINDGTAGRISNPQPIEQAPQAQAPNSLDIMAQQALSSNVLNKTDMSKFMDFSDYWNENLFRDAVKQGIQPEVDRVMGNMNADDQYYRKNEQQAYQNNQNALNQNFANRNAFFGGARVANQNKLTTDRNSALDEYIRKFNNQKLETQRSYDRIVEDQVGAERINKEKGYQEEKSTYQNQQYKY